MNLLHRINKPHLRFLLFAFFMFSVPHGIWAQLTKEQQSRAELLKGCKTDSDRVELLVDEAKKVPCDRGDEKLGLLNRALAIAGAAKPTRGWAKVEQKLGDYFRACAGNNDSAVLHFGISLALAQKASDTETEIYSYTLLGNILLDKANFRDAVRYYESALRLHPAKIAVGGIYANLGVVYRAIGDYPKAIHYYTLSYDNVIEDINAGGKANMADSMQLAGLLFEIGSVYDEAGDHESSYSYFQKSLAMNRVFEFQIIIATGNGLLDKDKYREAIGKYEIADSLAKTEHNDQKRVVSLKLLAKTHILAGNTKKALLFITEATKIAEAIGAQSDLSTIYAVFAQILAKSGDKTAAEQYLEKAVKIIKAHGNERDMKGEWLDVSNTYTLLNKPKEALLAYKKFVFLKDSMMDVNKANAITKMSLESEYRQSKIADSAIQAGRFEVKMEKQRIALWGGYVGLFLVMLMAYLIYRNYSQQKKANEVISLKNKSIVAEQQVSEKLLLNILPENVAIELKQKGSVDAKLFHNVTVLFTDFVGFTSSSERFTPQELISELHECFKVFDEIMDRHGVEKIKTVGDAYLAVSGLPLPNPRHAQNVINAALEIRAFIVSRTAIKGDASFHIRIGVHTGTVIAGIVGVRKFAYDIWGDTVNTAARMEQASETDKINLSQETYELIKDDFNVIHRGMVAAKNKGELPMYFVEGPKLK